MRMLLLTGFSGVGKTKLVSQVEAAAGAACHVIDPLREGGGSVVPTSPACNMLIVDHASHAPKMVGDALIWCGAHGKDICLVDSSRAAMAAAGVPLAPDAIEITLHGADAADGVSLTMAGESKRYTLPQFVDLLRQNH